MDPVRRLRSQFQISFPDFFMEFQAFRFKPSFLRGRGRSQIA
jgi:hypothetical protein